MSADREPPYARAASVSEPGRRELCLVQAAQPGLSTSFNVARTATAGTSSNGGGVLGWGLNTCSRAASPATAGTSGSGGGFGGSGGEGLFSLSRRTARPSTSLNGTGTATVGASGSGGGLGGEREVLYQRTGLVTIGKSSGSGSMCSGTGTEGGHEQGVVGHAAAGVAGGTTGDCKPAATARGGVGASEGLNLKQDLSGQAAPQGGRVRVEGSKESRSSHNTPTPTQGGVGAHHPTAPLEPSKQSGSERSVSPLNPHTDTDDVHPLRTSRSARLLRPGAARAGVKGSASLHKLIVDGGGIHSSRLQASSSVEGGIQIWVAVLCVCVRSRACERVCVRACLRAHACVCGRGGAGERREQGS